VEQATSLILISVAALLLPLVARRLLLPAVVLEILFGVLIGPQVANLVQESQFLSVLAELGFLLLMFLSGFEIDLRALQRQGAAQIATALILFALTLTLAFFLSRLLGYGVFMTFVLATTSVGLVVPVLRGTRRAATPLGQAVLLNAILADFLTLLGATAFAVAFEEGIGWELANIPLFFAIVAFVLLVLRRAAWWYPEKFERLFRGDDPEELGIRATLALMLAFVGLAMLLDIEPILGAFLAGTVFALVFRHRGLLERKLAGLSYGFLIPIFFINVGIHFDLGALRDPGVLAGMAGLLGAAVLVKMIPALVLLVRGLSPRQVLAAGVLLSARLSLIIAMAELGVELGLIDRTVEAGGILLAALTATFAPTLFRLLAPPLAATTNGTVKLRR
jgi:Kef-type K+ transport system membrane component KefB